MDRGRAADIDPEEDYSKLAVNYEEFAKRYKKHITPQSADFSYLSNAVDVRVHAAKTVGQLMDKEVLYQKTDLSFEEFRQISSLVNSRDYNKLSTSELQAAFLYAMSKWHDPEIGKMVFPQPEAISALFRSTGLKTRPVPEPSIDRHKLRTLAGPTGPFAAASLLELVRWWMFQLRLLVIHQSVQRKGTEFGGQTNAENLRCPLITNSFADAYGRLTDAASAIRSTVYLLCVGYSATKQDSSEFAKFLGSRFAFHGQGPMAAVSSAEQLGMDVVQMVDTPAAVKLAPVIEVWRCLCDPNADLVKYRQMRQTELFNQMAARAPGVANPGAYVHYALPYAKLLYPDFLRQFGMSSLRNFVSPVLSHLAKQKSSTEALFRQATRSVYGRKIATRALLYMMAEEQSAANDGLVVDETVSKRLFSGQGVASAGARAERRVPGYSTEELSRSLQRAVVDEYDPDGTRARQDASDTPVMRMAAPAREPAPRSPPAAAAAEPQVSFGDFLYNRYAV